MAGPFTDVERSIFASKEVLSEDYQPDQILERDDEIDKYRHARQQPHPTSLGHNDLARWGWGLSVISASTQHEAGVRCALNSASAILTRERIDSDILVWTTHLYLGSYII